VSGLLAAPGWSALTARLRSHQPRRGIPPEQLALLVALGVLPLLLVTLRVLAAVGHEVSLPVLAGDWLNRHFSLLWIAAADRAAVLHVVQLPLAALLVALTRLTLGIRVLGFRSILIAIGMREVGVLPSLLLIATIAGAVVVVRPMMRRSGMPLYARVSTILAIVAATMVAGLLLGAAFDSAILSSFAFFPVVILAMLAESIADTVARDSSAMAAWRTAATIVLALLIALLSAWPPLCELALACPELILTQLVMVVLVSEYLDFRLLEDFRPGRREEPAASGLQIAVVRNRWSHDVLRHAGSGAPQRYRRRSVQGLVDALRQAGHRVAVLEADTRLVSRLREFIPGTALGQSPRALVVNCAGGVQGVGRLCQVPSLCEMTGVPYTGPDPLAMAVISDQLALSRCLAATGLQTLSYRECEALPPVSGECGSWLVQHRFQSDRSALVVDSVDAMRRAAARIRANGDEALLAPVPHGRLLGVFVLGAGVDGRQPPRALPPLERGRAQGRYRAPARIGAAQREALNRTALRAFSALRCRGFARVDLWLAPDGTIGVLGIRVCDPLSPRSEIMIAARAAGLGFRDLVEGLIATTLGGGPSPHKSASPIPALAALT
jgi:D-alanine-D-alanine ligase